MNHPADSPPPFISFPSHHADGKLEPIHLFVSDTSEMPRPRRGQLHRHDFYELMWLARGEAAFFSDFQQYPLQRGALSFISPGQLHAWQGDWNAFLLIVIGFQGVALNDAMHHLLAALPYNDTSVRPYLAVAAEMQSVFDYLFTTALQRHRQSPREETVLLAYLNLILAEAQRLYRPAPDLAPPNTAQQLVQTFRQAVEQHYLQRLPVQGYADLLGVTPNHLVQTVRQTTGQTPKQIAQERLLLEAKRLIVHTPEPMAAIGELLSFRNASQFSRWFKTNSGLSPHQFRHQFVLP